MLALDREALQDLVLSACAKADWYKLSTCDAQAVVDDILHTTRTILADACHRRNQYKLTLPLPPELLAACFAFLPLEGRVLASHVSRTWRAVALESPSVWSDINCASGQDGPALVQMALSRSGSLPIQLEYHGWIDGDVADLIQTHLHHIASLKLYSYSTLSFLNHPAPLLHTLVLLDDAPLSEEFLARTPGRLATLRADLLFLPDSCPALSTLTTLSTSAARETTLDGIFAMCPCLQILSLWYLTRDNIGTPGRPPHSLADLSLSTNYRNCNLIAVYEAYKDSSTLHNVNLHCNMVGHADDFGHALYGAVDLAVKSPIGDIISVAALFAGGRRLTVSWPRDDEYTVAAGRVYPPFFAQAAACFGHLRTISVPLGLLPFSILDAPPLPALEELRVDVTPGRDTLGQPQEFDWSELAGLRDFAAARSDFRVVVNITHPRGPSADSARSLLACLSDCATHFAVTVTGFSANAIPDDVPRQLNISFVPHAY